MCYFFLKTENVKCFLFDMLLQEVNTSCNCTPLGNNIRTVQIKDFGKQLRLQCFSMFITKITLLVLGYDNRNKAKAHQG